MNGLWITVLSLALPCAATPADDAKEIRATIEGFVNPALAMLKDATKSQEERKKIVVEIVSPVFDFPLIAKLTLGRKHWPKLNKAQEKEFTDLFVNNIRDSYADKMDLLTDETIEFQDPVPTDKGKYEMLTYILSKGERHKMLYKVYKRENTWRVYDVEVSGISLVKSYGAQYDQFLQNASIDDLIEKLKEKSLAPPPELKAKNDEKMKP